MFKTILLAVDGSQHSDKAGEAVRGFHRSDGKRSARLYVRHRRPMPCEG